MLSIKTEMSIMHIEEMERSYIAEVLAHCGGKIAGKGGAAEILGMKRTTLISRMEKLGMRKTPTGSQMRESWRSGRRWLPLRTQRR